MSKIPPPKNPSKAQILFHLERLIHRWDDDPNISGYHPDALWLEEVRHLYKSLDDRLKRATKENNEMLRALLRLEEILKKSADSSNKECLNIIKQVTNKSICAEPIKQKE